MCVSGGERKKNKESVCVYDRERERLICIDIDWFFEIKI